MRLGGTVCFNKPEDFEERLVASGFRAITAPFTCDTPPEEIARLCRICEKHDVLIAEVGVWRNVFDPVHGAENREFARRQLALADRLAIPCCVNIAGTDSPAGWDAADRSNFTPETYERIVASVREIIDGVQPRTAC
jgi:Xylose isomerase-like TIM barrel.